MASKICKYCKKPFGDTPGRLKRRKFCSHECYWKALSELDEYRPKKKGVFLTCKYCQKEYYVTLSRKDNSSYCSYSCNIKHRKPKRKHYPRMEKHPMWKGGRIINSQGYVLIKTQNYPYTDLRGYAREHRLVMEKKLGRYLEPKEDIHHINGIKTDNRIENLELMKNRQEHIRLKHPRTA